MVGLSLFAARHPNERPTHPVDPSRAPSRHKTRRIRSSTGNSSYDRIIRPEPKTALDTLSAAKQPSSRSLSGPGLFAAYRVQTYMRVGMSVSFFS